LVRWSLIAAWLAPLALALEVAASASETITLAPVQTEWQTLGEVTELRAVESFRIISVNTRESTRVDLSDFDHPLVATESETIAGLSAESATDLRHLLRCLRTESEHALDPRLLIALARFARYLRHDIELISAYRAPRYAREHNFHVQGLALDVRVPGMSAFALRDVAVRAGISGIGTYPKSGMIHLDMRDVPYQWLDYSGTRLPNL
jgi:uncharacterized protein YcbK (DUF882 family)